MKFKASKLLKNSLEVYNRFNQMRIYMVSMENTEKNIIVAVVKKITIVMIRKRNSNK